jgi:hypothetical protein
MRHRDLDDESLEAFTGRGNPPSVGLTGGAIWSYTPRPRLA